MSGFVQALSGCDALRCKARLATSCGWNLSNSSFVKPSFAKILRRNAEFGISSSQYEITSCEAVVSAQGSS
eukprot:1735329-Amphidinium_carterae.1